MTATTLSFRPLRRTRVLAGVVAALALVAPASASALPVRGTIVPGVSLGGAKIGMTLKQVKRAWGRPTDCSLMPNDQGQLEGSCSWGPHQDIRATMALYKGRVNYLAIQRHGRYPKWKTAKGIRLGSSVARLKTAYGMALTDQGGGTFSLSRVYHGFVNETDFTTDSDTPADTDPITFIEIKQGPHV
jgi:hypothetical protein